MSGCLAAVAMVLSTFISVESPSDVIELSCDKPLRLSSIAANRRQIARYGKFEITFELDGHWDNPFDPTQVQVDAEFTSPGGETLMVPGFFYQQYTRSLREGEDTYVPIGEPVWKVRFAPTEVGTYRFQVHVTNAGQLITNGEESFTCTPDTANHGFVRVSKHNPLYFEYDDGTPTFALANCQWWDNIADIETFYPEFARAGGNMTRNFLMRIGELVDPPIPRPDRGFGKIDLDRSWRHDQMLELCEQLGISQQLGIANGTYFLRWDKARWRMCVYNTFQGGFMDSQEGQAKAFLTHPTARENFRRTLRYFVARWGYSTAVFSWNLWNEIDLIPEYPNLRDEAQEWHREMAQYLHEIDWAGHVIHTNFKTINGDPVLDSLPEMGIVSVNTYTSMDFAPAAETWIKRHLSAYQKPVMFGEFGIGHSYGEEGYAPHDPERIMAHNGMWSTALSGSAGTGLVFGWNWLENKRYYTYLAALASFVDGVPFSRREWQPVAVESFRFGDASQAPYYADVFVEGWHMNYQFPRGWQQHEAFRIQSDGRVQNHDAMSGFLGPPLGRRQVALKMSYPEDGHFTIFVPELFLRQDNPGNPRLVASLDGEIVVEQEIAPDGNNTRELYQSHTFAVPAGTHTITLENAGGGFFPVGYELGGFVLRDGPDLQVRGLQTEDTILLWLKSPKLTWLYARMGVEPPQQPLGTLMLANLPDATWVAEWLDTITNEWFRRSVERSHDGTLCIETPRISQSVAIRLRKVEDTR